MKTFTRIDTFAEGTCGYCANERCIYVVEADPKREGMYIMREYQTNADGKKARCFCKYYGKCNQSKILEHTKSMIEVEVR